MLNWTEEYPIPEAFYFTNNYTIEAHKSMVINVSMTFEKNDNNTEGGYFIITSDADKSEEPFYWPDTYSNNGKIEKLTNLEIILESDLPVGISSFSLMRRRNLEESSYLGENCNIIKNEVSNGRCGDGFFCNILWDEWNTLRTLVTNNHVLEEDDIKIGKEISIFKAEKKKFKLLLIKKEKFLQTKYLIQLLLKLKKMMVLQKNLFKM